MPHHSANERGGQHGRAPLSYLVRLGREVGRMRPSTGIQVQASFVDAAWITLVPAEAWRPRERARDAQRKCARGPRSKTKQAG
jgi:hypothetical protein